MKTIAYANLPTRLPILGSLVAWLVLDRLQAPDWVWGVVGTVYVLVWIGAIAKLIKSETINIFESKK